MVPSKYMSLGHLQAVASWNRFSTSSTHQHVGAWALHYQSSHTLDPIIFFFYLLASLNTSKNLLSFFVEPWSLGLAFKEWNLVVWAMLLIELLWKILSYQLRILRPISFIFRFLRFFWGFLVVIVLFFFWEHRGLLVHIWTTVVDLEHMRVFWCASDFNKLVSWPLDRPTAIEIWDFFFKLFPERLVVLVALLGSKQKFSGWGCLCLVHWSYIESLVLDHLYFFIILVAKNFLFLGRKKKVFHFSVPKCAILIFPWYIKFINLNDFFVQNNIRVGL